MLLFHFFKNNSLLYVPKVYSEFTTKNLLIMERVSGTPVDQIEDLKNSGVDLKLLSERGVEIFLKQVFTHNFFHADMHPGNIFINTKDANNPTYIAVDYAISRNTFHRTVSIKLGLCDR